MICLGIESTAHTFGVGIFDGAAKANKKIMYKTSGGIHPREASQFMTTNASTVIQEALTEANYQLNEIDCFSFAQGPGLGPCLRVGAVITKTLANYYNKPIYGVNHCVSHIDVGKWNKKAKNPLVVYVSGANTQILGFNGGKYRVYGETLDIGLGNALDVFGRSLNLEFPAGPKIEKLARESNDYHFLPYSVKGMDLSFTGLVTAASKSKLPKVALCNAFQETIFGMLVEVSERALAHTKKKELMLVGGVAQNQRLCSMLSAMAKEHKAKFLVPENQYNSDNGFMIALTGWLMHKNKIKQKDLKINQKWRTDEVEISWS